MGKLKVKNNINNNTWKIQASNQSLSVLNPIREIVDKLDMNDIPPDLPFISVAIGDPTKFPNLPPCSIVTKAVEKAVLSEQWNGYAPSFGLMIAREAIAKKYTNKSMKYTADDVILGNGCSDAIVMAINVFLDPGQNILLPKPGFPFYKTVVDRFGLDCKYYNLMADAEWEIDCEHMESLIDANTRAIMINNPSNPCGSVFSKQTVLKVIDIARRYQLPIISDEIYSGMVFDDNHPFYSMAELSADVPVLILSGLAKQYLVPGWRVGWIVIHDPLNTMIFVLDGLRKLSTLLLGPNTIVQAAIPAILSSVPDSFHCQLNEKLCRQSNMLYSVLNANACLNPIQSSGAMYLMCEIRLEMMDDSITDDVQFANLLLKEQALLVLPGKIFGCDGYFRVVVCPPMDIIIEIGKRMRTFCENHSKKRTILSKL